MTEAQEVLLAFAGGCAGFPASAWIFHQAEQRIRSRWNEILYNFALSSDPFYWAYALAYLDRNEAGYGREKRDD